MDFFNFLKLFSYHYKDGIIETARCPGKKLKQNFRGREHLDLKKRKKLEKDKKEQITLLKM